MVQSNQLKGYLLALVGILVLSPDALLIRLIGNDAWQINAWRGLGGGLIVLFYCYLFFGHSVFSQLRLAGYRILWVSMVSGIATLCFVYSIVHANVTDVLIILAFSPLMSALLSAIFLKESINWHTWVATIICGIGLSVLFYQKMGGSEVKGLLTAFSCAFFMAIQFVIIRSKPTVNFAPTIGFGNLLNGLVSLGLASHIALTPTQIMPMAVLLLLVTTLSFILLALSLRYITAPETGLIMLLESILGSLWVWFFIQEQPTPLTLAAGSLVIITLIIHGLFSIKR